MNAPEQIQQLYSSADVAALAAIRDFRVERYQVKSATEGEPRSLRFTFEFDDNENFGECTLTKEFEYRPAVNNDGPGDLVSKAVPIKWKNKKNDLTKGMLDLAVDLEAAEEAMKLKKGGKQIDLVEREGLWQYEKLREAIVKSQDADDDEPTFLNWFGFRGAVDQKPEATKEANGDGDEEDDDEDDLEGMLDVEIFPLGEDVAIALAEELYPEAIDIFMQAQEDEEDDEDMPDFDGIEDDEDDDEEAPELVKEDGDADDAAEGEAKRPNKRQRTN